MQQDYTYAVARIRYRESRLLTNGDLNALLSAKDVSAVIRTLRDKGWGDSSSDDSPEALLRAEENKMWSFIAEIVPERSTLDFLLVPNDYHNLKVAVKAITRDQQPGELFIRNSTIDPDVIDQALRKREYDALPADFAATAKQALTVLLETCDGQLCDLIIDRACMEHVGAIGRASDNEIIRLYCELFTASADIKIAVRSADTHKSLDFIRRSMAPCDTLDVGRLASAAALGRDEILRYLGETRYKGAVEAIGRSMSAFEKWCDDELTKATLTQKWEPFTIGPVVAYILARQNELKAVRMILSAKVNDLPEETIKERLRMMYV